jgi:hypothetical protein
MQCLKANDFASPGIFWCPRCGTICGQTDIPQGDRPQAPKLVERCREFEKSLVAAGMMTDVQPWRTLGIAESIHPPADRPNKE